MGGASNLSKNVLDTDAMRIGKRWRHLSITHLMRESPKIGLRKMALRSKKALRSKISWQSSLLKSQRKEPSLKRLILN